MDGSWQGAQDLRVLACHLPRALCGAAVQGRTRRSAADAVAAETSEVLETSEVSAEAEAAEISGGSRPPPCPALYAGRQSGRLPKSRRESRRRDLRVLENSEVRREAPPAEAAGTSEVLPATCPTHDAGWQSRGNFGSLRRRAPAKAEHRRQKKCDNRHITAESTVRILGWDD